MSCSDVTRVVLNVAYSVAMPSNFDRVVKEICVLVAMPKPKGLGTLAPINSILEEKSSVVITQGSKPSMVPTIIRVGERILNFQNSVLILCNS